MKSYEEFKAELVVALKERYPDAKIVEKDVLKINVKKEGIGIQKGKGIEAVLYPQDIYPMYMALEDMQDVLDVVEICLEFEKVEACKELLTDWEQVKQHIKPYVIGLEQNRELLSEYQYIYRERLDLVYGCYVDLPIEEDGSSGHSKVNQQMLRCWGVTEDEVFEMAEKNKAYEIKPMRVVQAELLGIDDVEDETLEIDNMFVLSSSERIWSAAAMFDTEVIHAKAEELQTNFYILPCSIHEVILIKEHKARSVEELREIVSDINETTVAAQEVLSNTVYYYDREKNEVRITE